MIGLGGGARVYLAAGVTDMRRGIAGLCAQAQNVLREAPGSGAPKFDSKTDKRLISFRPNGQKCYNTSAVRRVLAG